MVWALLSACSLGQGHYLRIEDSLRAGNYQAADSIVAKAESDYGTKARVLYGMDRGFTLQLSGQYEASNEVLSAAEDEVDRLFTRKIRNEALSFLVNDNELPFEGDPYEQVMINVMKAINYALQQNWQEALVEARRLDHRLNVIADRETDKDGYRDDGFARYLTGILYEAAEDLNNALVAYRRAYDAYRRSMLGKRIGVPVALRADLLRVSNALGLTDEFQEYRRAFPNTTWRSHSEQRRLAQVVLISYNGRAPARVDQFVDVPLGMDAAQLVLLSRGIGGGTNRTRTAESLLYGLNGKIVRIALPRLVPQRSSIVSSHVVISGAYGTYEGQTEPMHSITALADKRLSERMPGIAARAAARAAIKYGLAEAAERGMQSAMSRHDGQRNDLEWVAFVAGALLKTAALATEESDKRSWRTLPDEIQVARLWVPAGEYDVHVQALGGSQRSLRPSSPRRVALREGEMRFLLERAIQ
ncbi:hypothetical protein YTPLAS18_23500 [Nitrospira sp.]|nr:hypothetical protein YTPLAS18_23500 [Nitrospira sp.]